MKIKINKTNILEINELKLEKLINKLNDYLNIKDVVNEVDIHLNEEKRLVARLEIKPITLKDLTERLGLKTESIYKDLRNLWSLDFIIEGKIEKQNLKIKISYDEDTGLYIISIDEDYYFVIRTTKDYLHKVMELLRKNYDFDVKDLTIERIILTRWLVMKFDFVVDRDIIKIYKGKKQIGFFDIEELIEKVVGNGKRC